MAKTEKPQEGQVEKDEVVLQRLTAAGGELILSKAKAERLLKLEKKIGLKNYVIKDTDGNSGSGENKGTMGGSEE